jgi:type II secretory pathway predicted ATPase ExeA
VGSCGVRAAYPGLLSDVGVRGIHTAIVTALDEAHLLAHDQRESVRLLTNQEMASSSPFACLLIGQPTLRRKIKLGVLAALDQRIAVRFHMNGMAGEDTAGYLRHHIALAGRTDTLFTEEAGFVDGDHPEQMPVAKPRRHFSG